MPGPPEPGLDLVGDEQRAELVADPAHGRQVVGGRDDDPALALDRLEQHGDDGLVHRFPERESVAVRHRPEAGRVRPEVLAGEGSSENETIVVVRPWKFPDATTIVACPAGTPLTR